MKRFLYVMSDILSSHEEKIEALRAAAKGHVEQLASCQVPFFNFLGFYILTFHLERRRF
jgi:hypothetical protein